MRDESDSMGVGCPTSASSAPRVVGSVGVIVVVVVVVTSCGGTSHGDGGGLGSSV